MEEALKVGSGSGTSCYSTFDTLKGVEAEKFAHGTGPPLIWKAGKEENLRKQTNKQKSQLLYAGSLEGGGRVGIASAVLGGRDSPKDNLPTPPPLASRQLRKIVHSLKGREKCSLTEQW